MKYRKTSMLTPAKKKFAHIYAQTDNASEAVRQAYPHLTNRNTIKDKGHRLLTNTHILQDIAEQKAIMDINAGKAALRIGEIIDNGAEHNSLIASKFAYEHTHGKARQKIHLNSAHVLVTYDLSGGKAGPVPQEILDQLKD